MRHYTSLRHRRCAPPHGATRYVYVSKLFENLLTFGVKRIENSLTVGLADGHKSLPNRRKCKSALNEKYAPFCTLWIGNAGRRPGRLSPRQHKPGALGNWRYKSQLASSRCRCSGEMLVPSSTSSGY